MDGRSKITGIHPCDDTAQVVTVTTPAGDGYVHRHEPCAECPWRKDSPIGAFPVEAYRHSAATCYDMAQTTFACHMSGKDRPATCAGFLLSAGARHNFSVRMAVISGRLNFDSVSSDVPVYETYQEMAVANGVDPDDPVLRSCRT
jgi:hypothetical protein